MATLSEPIRPSVPKASRPELCAEPAALREEVRASTILITGSEGLIGRALAHACADAATIIGLDVEESPDSTGARHFVACDLTQSEAVERALAEVRELHGTRLDSVIHLAGHHDSSGEPSPLYRDLTVEGTRRLIRGLQAFDVGQFQFSSTHDVMKSSEDGEAVTEASDLDPGWEYPKSKVAAEKVLLNEHGKIPVVILRIAGVYDEECHAVPLAQQMDRIYTRRFGSHLFPGNPSHGQAYVHLDDLVELMLLTIARRGDLRDFEIFLAAEPGAESYDELQDRFGALIHGKEWPTIGIPKVVAKAGAWVEEKLAPSEEGRPFLKPWMIDFADDHYPIDITHAREDLGWEPVNRLRDTLPSMVRTLKQDPRRWYEVNGIPAPENLDQVAAAR